MAKPQHRTPEHRAARKHWTPIVARGEAYCVEPICVMTDRWIEPGTEWHVSHDTTGTVILGPSHWQCNLSEAGKRGHAIQMGRLTPEPRHWPL